MVRVPTLKPGTTLDGYEILTFHGKGGMGEIFRARQLSIGREVALKILSPELARRNPQFATSFVEEARAAGRLNHPNIIAVHDVGKIKHADRDEYLYYFSMEFVDGENLKQILDREGVCPMPLLEKTMRGMADALVYAETMSMIHRDIKPENIMVTTDERIKLADFGLAQQIEGDGAEADRDEKGRIKVMGTPRYMSPEQARGRTLDGRCDQYALGATLYHLLTGSPPYRRESSRATMKAHVTDPVPDPSELVRVSPAWRKVCMKMMAKSPDERFETAVDLKNALELAMNGQTFGGRSTRHSQVSLKRPQRNSSSMLLFGVAGLIIIAAVIGLLVSMSSGDDPAPTNTTGFLGPNDQPANTTASNDPLPESAVDTYRVRAEQILRLLPRDKKSAIGRLDSELNNPYFASEAAAEARTLLVNERSKLSSALAREERENAEKRLALNKRLQEVRSLINRNAIGEARSKLSSFSAADRSVISAAYAAVLNDLNSAETFRLDTLLRQIRTAAGEQRIEALMKEANDQGLSPATIQKLRQAARNRGRALATQAATEKASLAANRKREIDGFVAALDKLRADKAGNEPPQIDRFIALALDYRRRLSFDDLKQMSAHVQRIGELARETGSHLETYVKTEQPRISFEGSRGTIFARMDSLEDDGVWLDTGGGVLTKKKLSDPDIRLAELIKKVAKHHNLSADHVASYVWMWRTGDGTTTNFVDTNYVKAVAYFGSMPAAEVAAGAPDKPAENVEKLFFQKKIQFAEVGPAAMSWFEGNGMVVEEDGLVWNTDEHINVAKLLKEETIPTLHLKDELKPPFTITMRVRVAPDSIILVGLREGMRGVRLGLDTRTSRVGGVITGASENIISKPLPTKSDAVDDWMNLTVGVNKRGVAGFRINGKRYVASREDFQLPNKGPMNLVFQALNTTNNSESEIIIESLEIRAAEEQ